MKKRNGEHKGKRMLKILISMASSVFLQLLFLYIVISGILLDFNPWYAVIVYISVAILSLILGIYSIVSSVRESSNVTLLTIPIGVVTT